MRQRTPLHLTLRHVAAPAFPPPGVASGPRQRIRKAAPLPSTSHAVMHPGSSRACDPRPRRHASPTSNGYVTTFSRRREPIGRWYRLRAYPGLFPRTLRVTVPAFHRSTAPVPPSTSIDLSNPKVTPAEDLEPGVARPKRHTRPRNRFQHRTARVSHRPCVPAAVSNRPKRPPAPSPATAALHISYARQTPLPSHAAK